MAGRPPAEERFGKTPEALRDPSTAQLVHACGEHINLVIDNVFTAITDGVDIIVVNMNDQRNDIKRVLYRPLQRALLSHRADCQCSPFDRLVIRSVVISGSYAEGLTTPALPPSWQTSSDVDKMMELGPVRWEFPGEQKTSIVERDFAESAQGSPTRLNNHDADTLPRLAIVETENPGFVLLLQERRSDCPHEEMLPFKAEAVNQFMSDYQRLIQDDQVTNRTNNGPATSYVIETNEAFDVNQCDEVPCLHVPVWWFSEEFFTRPRRQDWPPEAVRNRIKQFGLHLVPVGAAGSKTEKCEWRLSFSMAEVLIAHFLTETQKRTLVVFKLCREALGEEGKVVKSYYMKTALLWLCEGTPKEDWTSISRGVLQLVDFLIDAVKNGSLPCFFWSEINLFRSVDRAGRRDMKRALEMVQKHVLKLMAHGVCAVCPGLQPMIAHEGRRLTERQVRVCMARYVIRMCVVNSIYRYMTATQTSVLDNLIAVLSRSWSRHEVSIMLRSSQHWHLVQKDLFQALTVAPDDVAAQVRLSDSGDGGFVWDAAPLLALLTDEDMQFLLLGDPDAVDAVRAWLRRQHQRPEAERPPGLPADLRSPRDRCDLLLNTPLLCLALREGVPGMWSLYCQCVKKYTFAIGYMTPSMWYSAISQSVREQFSALADNLRHKLGMDDRTAELVLARFLQERAKSADDAEARAEIEMLRRTIPDYWGIWPVVFAHSS